MPSGHHASPSAPGLRAECKGPTALGRYLAAAGPPGTTARPAVGRSGSTAGTPRGMAATEAGRRARPEKRVPAERGPHLPSVLPPPLLSALRRTTGGRRLGSGLARGPRRTGSGGRPGGTGGSGARRPAGGAGARRAGLEAAEGPAGRLPAPVTKPRGAAAAARSPPADPAQGGAAGLILQSCRITANIWK